MSPLNLATALFTTLTALYLMTAGHERSTFLILVNSALAALNLYLGLLPK